MIGLCDEPSRDREGVFLASLMDRFLTGAARCMAYGFGCSGFDVPTSEETPPGLG